MKYLKSIPSPIIAIRLILAFFVVVGKFLILLPQLVLED